MDWKLQQEISRLQLDIDNLESSMQTKIRFMRKRLERIKECTKESRKAKTNPGRQTSLFDK